MPNQQRDDLIRLLEITGFSKNCSAGCADDILHNVRQKSSTGELSVYWLRKEILHQVGSFARHFRNRAYFSYGGESFEKWATEFFDLLYWIENPESEDKEEEVVA